MHAGRVEAAAPRRRARWFRIGIVAVALLVLSLDYRSVTTTLTAAAARALTATGGWLLAAGGLAICSMVAFGLLRRCTVRAAGGRVSAREAIAVSYAAGAIHLTAPGGVVLSTAYVFRRLRRHGVDPAPITWSLAVSGVLSTVTLIGLGAAGFWMDRAAGSWTAFAPAAASIVMLAVGCAIALRRPDTVVAGAVRVVRWANRLLRRPPDAGVITLRATIADLRAVHTRLRDWPAAVGAAAANWLLDLLCLWACAHALGIPIQPWALLAAYAFAMAGASVSPIPGGVGVVDGILVLALTVGAGAPAGTAVGAVLLYRVIALGTLIVGGWGVVGLGTATRRAPAPVLPPSPAGRPG